MVQKLEVERILQEYFQLTSKPKHYVHSDVRDIEGLFQYRVIHQDTQTGLF